MWPVNMAQHTAKQKKNMVTTVWRANHRRVSSGCTVPKKASTPKAMAVTRVLGNRKKLSPVTQLVRNSPSRRMGRA